MDYKKVLLGFLSRAYNIDEQKFAELENSLDGDNAEDLLTESLAVFDINKVDELKNQVSKAREEAYGRATKEVLTKFEKNLADTFGLENPSEKGIDLVKAIVQKHVSDQGGKQLTDEEVKRHPLFLDLEERRQKEVREVEQTWTEKYNELNTSIERGRKLEKVKSKANEILSGLNPILPTNEVARQNQLNTFFSVLENMDYQVEEEKGRIVILNDGSPLVDSHNNLISFDSFVKEKAQMYWDFKEHTGGSNSTGAGDGEGSGNNHISIPKSLEELSDFINDPSKTPEEKERVAIAFEEAQNN